MTKRRMIFTGLILLVILILSACTQIPGTGADAQATQQAWLEEAARATMTMAALEQQLGALQTQVALGTPAAAATLTAVPPTPTPWDTATPANSQTVAPSATSTATATASATPTLTATPTATATATATFTPTPTFTPTMTPTITATPLPCTLATYVDDISVPVGTTVSPGQSFVKTWRVRNAGRCTWDASYDLVFYDGSLMNAAGVYDLPQVVLPGQTVDVSVEMYAPQTEGVYRSYWMLRDTGGRMFGLGAENYALFLEVQVKKPENLNYLDLTETYCLAEWTTGAGRIPCQGQRSDTRGFVRKVDNPILESGYQDDEPVLMTFPQMVNGGMISGKFPTLRIESGWRFRSIIGCAHQSPACDVTFQLGYQVGNGAVQTLGSWREAYEGNFTQIDVDLAALAGQDVNLILTVYANGSSHQDYAQWLAPRIVSTIGWNE